MALFRSTILGGCRLSRFTHFLVGTVFASIEDVVDR